MATLVSKYLRAGGAMDIALLGPIVAKLQSVDLSPGLGRDA